MRRLVAVIAALGVLLVGLSLALVVRPELADGFGYRVLLDSLGNGYFLVAGVAGLGFFYALYVGMSWWLAGGVFRTKPPDVERLPASAIPGTELDEAVAELTGERGRAARAVDDRERIQGRLTQDAVRTVARIENVALAEARRQVDAGDWTGNRYAADFVGGDEAPSPRWYQRIRDRVLRRNPFSRRVDETITAIADLGATEP